MPGKWEIINGVKYKKEEFQENSNTVEEKTTDNPLFVDGKWNIVKELTPQEVMKIIEEKQKKMKNPDTSSLLCGVGVH